MSVKWKPTPNPGQNRGTIRISRCVYPTGNQHTVDTSWDGTLSRYLPGFQKHPNGSWVVWDLWTIQQYPTKRYKENHRRQKCRGMVQRATSFSLKNPWEFFHFPKYQLRFVSWLFLGWGNNNHWFPLKEHSFPWRSWGDFHTYQTVEFVNQPRWHQPCEVDPNGEPPSSWSARAFLREKKCGFLSEKTQKNGIREKLGKKTHIHFFLEILVD